MCIAIYKPADKHITEEVLKNCYESNKDGAGFCYVNTDFLGVRRLVVKKYMDFDSLYKQYKRATAIAPDSHFLIHFRIGTHGVKSTFNCHPFYVNKNLAFIHNGIIMGVGTDKEKSDTQLFNEVLLKGLPKGWEYNASIRTLVEDFIGYSKLIFLNIKGDVHILNEKKGHWKDGIWFSNDSYKPRVVVSYPPVVRSYANGYKHDPDWWKIDEKSYEQCEYCTGQRQVRFMRTYKINNVPTLVCSTCGNELEGAGVLNIAQRISHKDYITYVNGSNSRNTLEAYNTESYM